MAANEVATLVSDATPYMTAAVGAYGGAVLAKARDQAADATVGTGLRLLQRVFGRRRENEPVPDALAALAGDLADPDALGAVRLAVRAALTADPAMLSEFRSILAEAPGPAVTQHVHAGRDAYVAARDMTVNRHAE